jgi:hypothetical protein
VLGRIHASQQAFKFNLALCGAGSATSSDVAHKNRCKGYTTVLRYHRLPSAYVHWTTLFESRPSRLNKNKLYVGQTTAKIRRAEYNKASKLTLELV